MNVQAVLFDCDGVIVDSEGSGLDPIAGVLAVLGIDLSRQGAADLFVGKPRPGVARTLRKDGHAIPADWHRGVYDRL